MSTIRLPLVALVACGLSVPTLVNAQETAATDPVGFVTVEIAGGAQGRTPTFISIPLLDSADIQGQVVGRITSLTDDSLTNSSAGWEAGALSNPASPFLVLITSGDAVGRMFLISANTSDTLTLSAEDLMQGNLADSGVKVDDQYKIVPCDTLSSFFGSPSSSGILGGANARVADTIVLVGPTGPKTYYYSTTQNSWVENARGVILSPNVPLRPYYGLIYNRQGETPLNLVITGSVPTVSRTVAVANAGATILAQYWPANTTLVELGLHNMPGWQHGPNARSADRVIIQNALGIPQVYFYNGVNWLLNSRGVVISDNVEIELGASVQVERRGSTQGYSLLTQQVPYSL